MKKVIIAIMFSFVLLSSHLASASESETTLMKSPLCPSSGASGPGTFAGSPNRSIPTVYGQLSQLESMAPPIKFNSTKHSVKLTKVWYEGTVTGQYVIPTKGNVEGMSINDKPVTITSGDIKTGCLKTKEFGEILVLFSNSMMSESVIIVMTGDQIKKIK